MAGAAIAIAAGTGGKGGGGGADGATSSSSATRSETKSKSETQASQPQTTTPQQQHDHHAAADADHPARPRRAGQVRRPGRPQRPGLRAHRPGQADRRRRAAAALVEAFRAQDRKGDIGYAYALYNLGNALRLSGRPADAIPFLEERLQISNYKRGVVQKELETARKQAGLSASRATSSDRGRRRSSAPTPRWAVVGSRHPTDCRVRKEA